MMHKKILGFFLACVVFAGCKKNLTPLDDNHRTFESIYSDPYFAEGILMNAYSRLPTNGYSFNDVATDDAVTNDKASGLSFMATGSWSAIANPVEQWNNSYTAIMYTNLFLREVDTIKWATLSNNNVNRLFNDRLKGEAYALRGWFLYNLLQNHAGYDAGGQLLGVPILTEYIEPGTDFRKPRNTFAECLTQIYNDLTEADKYLPLDFVNITNASQLPAQYTGFNIGDYNRVFGNFNRQRISRRIIEGMRVKIALLAASPAFNASGNVSLWEAAANNAGTVLARINGINGLDAQGGKFYLAANVNAINLEQTPAPVDQREMLWRGAISLTNGLEINNFAPTLFGNGRVNPTQNLVDAFPMANGYPITDPASGYVATNPYANRDPRLREYIVVNGSTMSGKTIWTKSDAPTIDAVDNSPTSTRTGYYMRKLLRDDVNANPNSLSTQKHYPVHIRYTEIFLAYAEAANEAWGPDGTGTFGFSARNVIAAIRRRAGITQPDNYLTAVTSKEDMRNLIRNERRLELSFEGSRFWDLRRWKQPLTEAAKGVTINNNVYTIQTVENRQYADFMYYGPIPILEVQKANLTQNKGW